MSHTRPPPLSHPVALQITKSMVTVLPCSLSLSVYLHNEARTNLENRTDRQHQITFFIKNQPHTEESPKASVCACGSEGRSSRNPTRSKWGYQSSSLRCHNVWGMLGLHWGRQEGTWLQSPHTCVNYTPFPLRRARGPSDSLKEGTWGFFWKRGNGLK